MPRFRTNRAAKAGRTEGRPDCGRPGGAGGQAPIRQAVREAARVGAEGRDVGQRDIVPGGRLARTPVLIALGRGCVLAEDDGAAERERLTRSGVHTEFGMLAGTQCLLNIVVEQRRLHAESASGSLPTKRTKSSRE
jgi:hypothetical protein